MKAVILAGGQGSRLRPLTENVPKPMVSVLGRPIMEHIVGHIKKFGIRDIVSTLHYRPQSIRDHFADGTEFGVNMFYTLETEPLGTAGSVKLGQKYLDETFLVMGGDALVDFDFGAFLEFHQKTKAKVSLCLTRVRDPGEFGIVITDNDGRVLRFLEKPGPSEVFSDTVNTGIYLIEPEVLDHIPMHKQYDFAGDLFPALMALGEPIYGYVAEGYWSDIGTLEQLRQAHWDMLDGKVNLPVTGNQIRDGIWVGQGADIAPDARLEAPCWLGEDVHINKGARIGPYAVLSNNTEVERHATVNHSIVMRNSFIGEASDLRNALVARNNIIEARCDLRDDVVLGAGCRLGAGVIIKAGVLVWPEKVIDAGSTVGENLVWESPMRPSIFGSRGVSGLANLHITPEFAAVLGKAFGAWAKKGRKVAVSRDAHPFSRMIKRALVSGLLSTGVDVEDLENSSTPVTRFITTAKQDIVGGIHVRIASKQSNVGIIEMYNGNGLPLNREVRRKIEATFHRADFPKVSIDQVGHLSYTGLVQERYSEYLLEHLDSDLLKQQGKNLIYFAEDHSTVSLLGQILNRRGVPHLQMGGYRQNEADRLNQDLSVIARLNHSMAIIVEHNSEKFRLIDDDGALLTSERGEELLTAAFIQSAPADQPVFLTPDHARFLRQMADKHKRQVVLTRKDPAARLQEANEVASEHCRWLEFTHYYLGFDAISGLLHLLEFLGKENLTLREFERQTPASFRKSVLLPCPWASMGRVMRELSNRPESNITQVPEGVYLEFDGGQTYILPSSDAPQLEVTIEAKDANTLPEFAERIKRELRRLAV